METGVYKITCKPTGKIYVGSAAKSFRLRFNLHRSMLSRQKHHSRHMQRAWNKYGPDAFTFEPILICAPEHVIMYEQIAITALQPQYNSSFPCGNGFGTKKTEKQKKKKSEELKIQWANGQRKDVFSSIRNTPEYKAKLAAGRARYVAENRDVVAARAKNMASRRAKRYSVRGEALTWREISEKYGFKIYTIKRRLEKGLRGEDLIAPLRPGRRRK